MRVMQPSRAVLSSLLLCIGLATTATAQEEPAPVAFVTGVVAEAYVYEAVSDEAISEGRDDIAYELRGYQVEGGSQSVKRQVVEWSDPRLPPDLWLASDSTGIYWPDPFRFAGVNLAFSTLLEGEAGRWVGTGRWLLGHEPLSFYVLTGEGAYEGLHAMLRGVPHENPAASMSGFGDLAYEGYIYEAELTPFPDTPVPITTETYQYWPPE